MSRRKVYIVKSGTLHKTEQRYWLSPTYHTSKKGALAYAELILKVNQATNILERETHGDKELRWVDYNGEEGKYLARILVEWDYINSY